MEELFNTALNIVMDIGLRIISVILLWYVGNFVIKKVVEFTEKALQKSKVDITLHHFLLSFVNIALKVFLIISIIELCGIDATGIVAVLGAGSVAVGLAFQGALSNLAGGILLIFLKPYKVGDFIEVAGHTGVVKSIEILATKIDTVDNKLIIIPNGAAASSSVVNYSANALRRVDFSFGVGYESDLKLVKETILNVVNAHDKVLKDPAPFVRLGEQADSSLNYTVRLWTQTENYWDVHFDIMEQITDAFNEKNINIPYPQMDIHQK